MDSYWRVYGLDVETHMPAEMSSENWAIVQYIVGLHEGDKWEVWGFGYDNVTTIFHKKNSIVAMAICGDKVVVIDLVSEDGKKLQQWITRPEYFDTFSKEYGKCIIFNESLCGPGCLDRLGESLRWR